MWNRRDILHVMIGVVVALALHLALLPAAGVMLLRAQMLRELEPIERALRPKAREQQHLDKPEKTHEPQPTQRQEPNKLGDPEAPPTPTVAWISHDQFEQLMWDEPSVTDQPALQDQVDPVAAAPIDPEPTPPMPPESPEPPEPREPPSTRAMAVAPQPSTPADQMPSLDNVAAQPPPALPAIAPTDEAADDVEQPATASAPLKTSEVAAAVQPDVALTPSAERAEAPAADEGTPSESEAANTPQVAMAGEEMLPDVDPSIDDLDAPIESIARVESTGPQPSQPTPVAQEQVDLTAPDVVAEMATATREQSLDATAAQEQRPASDPEVDTTTAEATANVEPVDAETEKTTPSPTVPTAANADTTPESELRPLLPASGLPSSPTAAARSDQQADPVARVNVMKRKLGDVQISRGLKVKPVRPRFGMTALRSGVPANARAVITFNNNGRVVRVTLKKSTGYAGFDSPILQALYRWRAEGPILEHSKEPIEVQIDLVFHD